MRVLLPFPIRAAGPPGLVAVARVDRRTKNITRRLVLVLAAAVTVLVAVLFSTAEPIMARYFGAIWYSNTNWLIG